VARLRPRRASGLGFDPALELDLGYADKSTQAMGVQMSLGDGTAKRARGKLGDAARLSERDVLEVEIRVDHDASIVTRFDTTKFVVPILLVSREAGIKQKVEKWDTRECSVEFDVVNHMQSAPYVEAEWRATPASEDGNAPDSGHSDHYNVGPNPAIT
jgi:hypothetical protein